LCVGRSLCLNVFYTTLLSFIKEILWNHFPKFIIDFLILLSFLKFYSWIYWRIELLFQIGGIFVIFYYILILKNSENSRLISFLFELGILQNFLRINLREKGNKIWGRKRLIGNSCEIVTVPELYPRTHREIHRQFSQCHKWFIHSHTHRDFENRNYYNPRGNFRKPSRVNLLRSSLSCLVLGLYYGIYVIDRFYSLMHGKEVVQNCP